MPGLVRGFVPFKDLNCVCIFVAFLDIAGRNVADMTKMGFKLWSLKLLNLEVAAEIAVMSCFLEHLGGLT